MYYNPIEAGKRIQNLRKEKGLTQVALAEQLNISLDHLRKIENGHRGCSVDLLVCLSDLFGVSLDYLVLGRGSSGEAAQNKVQSLIDQLEAFKATL